MLGAFLFFWALYFGLFYVRFSFSLLPVVEVGMLIGVTDQLVRQEYCRVLDGGICSAASYY